MVVTQDNMMASPLPQTFRYFNLYVFIPWIWRQQATYGSSKNKS